MEAIRTIAVECNGKWFDLCSIVRNGDGMEAKEQLTVEIEVPLEFHGLRWNGTLRGKPDDFYPKYKQQY